METIKKILSFIKGLPLRYKIVGGIVLLVVVVGLLRILGSSGEPLPTSAQAAHVTIASVASLSNQGGPLPITGRVTSVSQASITALTGGQVTTLRVKLGDRVSAGSVIASFENSSQQAAVLQAQGSYNAALAAQKSVSPVDARLAAINAYKSAFTTLDTELESNVDQFFGAPGPYGPQLLIDAPNYDYGELSRNRAAIAEKMDKYRNSLAGADSSDPAVLLAEASATTLDVSNFINKLAVSANRRDSRASEDMLAALDTARAAVATLSATLTTATQTYRSGSVTSSASTDATVLQALGGLRAAQASLEKTIARAPISGTIVSLPVHLGDYTAPGAAVAVISNPGALQVESYVTAADAKTLRIGGKATIEGSTPGTIVFIAPALDPTTGKIQVKVGLGGSTSLTDGSTVTVTLERALAPTTSAKKEITIPISAVKITPQGPVVFTVASSTLMAHPVVFGAIVGSQVTISSGLTLDMAIVTDARGLSDGQEVVVDQH